MEEQGGHPVWHSVSCDYMYLSCLLSQLCAPLRTHNVCNCVSLSHLLPCELCAPPANLWVPPSYLISCGYHSVSCVHHWVSCIIQVSCQLWVMLLQLWNHSVKCVDNSTQLTWWYNWLNSCSEKDNWHRGTQNWPSSLYNWPVGINSWVKCIFNSVSDNMAYWVVCWSERNQQSDQCFVRCVWSLVYIIQ